MNANDKKSVRVHNSVSGNARVGKQVEVVDGDVTIVNDRSRSSRGRSPDAPINGQPTAQPMPAGFDHQSQFGHVTGKVRRYVDGRRVD
ncbi:hypothetical protein [Actinokineospora enzanensis]|uniref:hypothetical protein n=1 Tax=Actinokineospora enzanensis TaxID=155975 RepID=UPI00035E919C|nr:hypothetical protein [Actinokineospora enzanensis]